MFCWGRTQNGFQNVFGRTKNAFKILLFKQKGLKKFINARCVWVLRPITSVRIFEECERALPIAMFKRIVDARSVLCDMPTLRCDFLDFVLHLKVFHNALLLENGSLSACLDAALATK